jgi:hypothetical protein
MTVHREVIESPMEQGLEEVISYSLDTTPWGGAPSAPECTVYDVTDRDRIDITEDVMPTNEPVVDEDDPNTIILSPLRDIEEKKYRVEVKWTSSGNVFEAYCIINGKI